MDSPPVDRAEQSTKQSNDQLEAHERSRRGLSAVCKRTVRRSTERLDGQQQEELLAEQDKARRGLSATYSADCPPYRTRSRTSTWRCKTTTRGRSAVRTRTVRRQATETDRVLNPNSKPAQNLKSIQTTSKNSQTSGT